MLRPSANGNPDAVKASLALWLYLTTNPYWNQYDPNATPATLQPLPSAWSPSALPANLAALEPAGHQGDVQKILDYLASTPSTVDGMSLWDHFRFVQGAFQAVMRPKANAVGIISPYPVDDPDCPGSAEWVTQLSFSYPANFEPTLAPKAPEAAV